ncbi:unnamed protein product [Pipistrellus nathusii]|uniref:Uncharacterized protein n=1 Tax=Pipistrellus nathusii TaxID=59473 RepID=A0ABN9Z414_PIPNA
MKSRSWSSPFPCLGPPPSGVGDPACKMQSRIGEKRLGRRVGGEEAGRPCSLGAEIKSRVAVVRSPSDPRPDAPDGATGPRWL